MSFVNYHWTCVTHSSPFIIPREVKSSSKKTAPWEMKPLGPCNVGRTCILCPAWFWWLSQCSFAGTERWRNSWWRPILSHEHSMKLYKPTGGRGSHRKACSTAVYWKAFDSLQCNKSPTHFGWPAAWFSMTQMPSSLTSIFSAIFLFHKRWQTDLISFKI